jgi:putative PIN family toxin of toxin-antitoxin system
VRVVIDANVFVSAAIRTGPSHRIVQAWLRDGAFEVIACPTLLGEVRDVLTQRPRLRRWIDVGLAEQFIAELEAYVLLIADPDVVESVTRDPDDDYLVTLARIHDVDHIVTGDHDLLDWADRGTPVLSPAEFDDRLRQHPNDE